MSEGDGVVAVDVSAAGPEAIRTLIDDVRDVQPLDMPSVEVPPGEYGKGEWAPRDIRPDGPSGEVDPGTSGRSV